MKNKSFVVFKKKITFSIKENLIRYIDNKIVDYQRRLRKINYKKVGQNISIFAFDDIGLRINQFGIYEGEELNLIIQYFKPISKQLFNGIAIDIGANIGNHSIFFSKFFNKVFSFEPHPKVFKLLKFNTETLKNIYQFKFGLGNKKEIKKITENKLNLGKSRFKKNTNNVKQKKFIVQIKKLDDELKKIKKINLIKIDVEGEELEVIKGSKNIIKLNNPIILFELDKSQFINGDPAVIKYLKKFNYKFAFFDSNTEKSKLLKIIANIQKMFFGVTRSISTNEFIPQKFHSMIIGIPKKFHDELL